MSAMDEWQLLQAYTKDRSEAAFRGELSLELYVKNIVFDRTGREA